MSMHFHSYSDEDENLTALVHKSLKRYHLPTNITDLIETIVSRLDNQQSQIIVLRTQIEILKHEIRTERVNRAARDFFGD